MIISGQSKCSICDKVLDEQERYILIPAFLEDESHVLFQYTDTGFHQDCFNKSSFRDDLVSAYNEYYKAHYRGMRIMNDQGEILENNGTDI